MIRTRTSRQKYPNPQSVRKNKYSNPQSLSPRINDMNFTSNRKMIRTSRQKYSNPQSLSPRINDMNFTSSGNRKDKIRMYLDDDDDDKPSLKSSDKTKAGKLIHDAKSFADMKSAVLLQLKEKLSEIQELIDRNNLDNELRKKLVVVKKNIENAILYQETMNKLAIELSKNDKLKNTNLDTLEKLRSDLKRLPNDDEYKNFIDTIENEIKERGGNTNVRRNDSERLDKDALTVQQSEILSFLSKEENINNITKEQLKELERLIGVVKGSLFSNKEKEPTVKELMTIILQKIKGEDAKPNFDKLSEVKFDGKKRKRSNKRKSRSKKRSDGKKRRSRRKSHSKRQYVKRSRSDGKKRRSNKRKSRSLKKSTRKRHSRRRY
jgi:hypothetical protein